MRDYQKAWISDEGQQYRTDFYERQGLGRFDDNPACLELIGQLERFSPSSILEIGCGFGRLLGPVARYFQEIEVCGCDVSMHMLNLCSEDLYTFYCDICKPLTHSDHWDVAFCRGVFLYFNEEQLPVAMKNVVDSVETKMLVYEWPGVCEKMKAAIDDVGDLFEYHLIEEKSE